ncbi:MAG TPA: FG-GAP-like repeat-containing protein [Pyrinomonadaceae bacterium]
MPLANGSNRARLLTPALFIALAILLCAASGAAQTATFSGRDYPIVGNTHITADFNGDGKPDLAGAGLNVRVMLGNGDGSFRPQVEYPAGGYTQDIAAGDLNNDGHSDLVVTNNNAQIGLTVLLGNGDGTFGVPVSYLNDTGSDSPSVVVTDFDQDGRLDVVAAHQIACFNAPCVVADSISLWRGTGDGSLQPAQQIHVGPGLSRLAVGDFNNDGRVDLGIAAAFGKVYILLGQGDGSFRQLPDLLIVQGVDNTDIEIGDFNNDAIQDLAVAPDADHRTVVLLGNGDGTFRQSASIPDALQERVGELAIADFNNDSFQDVALGMALCCSLRNDGMFGVLYGNGDGSFKPVVRYLIPNFVVGSGGGYLLASDLNGDGKQDITLQLRGNNAGTTVLLNTTGRASSALAFGGLSVSPSSLVGGTQAEVEVYLAPGAVAPSGSLPLTISSSNPALVSVPTGSRSLPVAVGITAGMTNVRFKVDTASVTTQQVVTINISNSRIGSRSIQLTLTPPTTPLALGSIQMQPPGVYGGNDGSGVVALATGHVAPAGGAVVTLINDNPNLVSTPDSVTIPAGQTNASFPVQTVTTGVTTSVNISASYGGATKTATLTIAAPSQNVPIAAVALAPDIVVGGGNIGVRVTVNLSAGAPAEGATIMLASSNPAIVNVPRSIRANFSGQTSVFADVFARTVSTPTPVTITATYGSSSQSALLTVTPPPATAPTLTSLSLNPSSINGGSSLQGAILLSAPASTATSINLSSSSALASVPASVTVAAGASSANFIITTASVASPASAIISATLNATTQTATLTLNPAPAPADAVSITLAQYDTSKRVLRVEATSARSNVTLQVFVTASGQLIGTLTNSGGGKYTGQFNAAANPQSINVRSSGGGSATRSVVAK